MTVDELVAQLQEFPGYYDVAVRITKADGKELVADAELVTVEHPWDGHLRVVVEP